jgi:hypothetical protein
LAIHGDRVAKRFKVLKNFEGIETTAARFPKGVIQGVGGTGGEIQLLAPPNWKSYLQPLD